MGVGPGTELLVVSGDPLWPVAGGGRERAAGLVGALAGRFSVRVLAPVEGSPPEGMSIGVVALPEEEPVARLVAVLSPQPRRGRALLGPARSRALLQAIADHRPRAVLFLAGYLAAAAPSIEPAIFVDFAELSVRRTAATVLESVKARWWEPLEARRAVAVSASTPDDVALLASWGARAVLVPDATSASTWEQASAPLTDAVEQVVRAPRMTSGPSPS